MIVKDGKYIVYRYRYLSRPSYFARLMKQTSDTLYFQDSYCSESDDLHVGTIPLYLDSVTIEYVFDDYISKEDLIKLIPGYFI